MSAFQVVSTSPGVNSAHISCTGTLTVEFSNDIDRRSVAEAQIYLTRISGETILAIDPSTITVNERRITVPFPAEAGQAGLLPHTTYQVTVAAGLRDIHKYTLQVPYSWMFTTAHSDTPAVIPPILVQPAMGQYVEINQLSFSWIPNVLATRYELQISAERTFNPLAIPQVEIYGASTTGTIGTELLRGSYRARVRTVTPGGTSDWSNVIEFIYAEHIPVRGEPPAFGSLWEDQVKPAALKLIRTTPRDHLTNQTPQTISLTFNHLLDSDTLTQGHEAYAPPTIEAMGLYDGTSQLLPTSGWSLQGATLTYTPDPTVAPFVPNTTYQVYLQPGLRMQRPS